jgi:hypothetical protein
VDSKPSRFSFRAGFGFLLLDAREPGVHFSGRLHRRAPVLQDEEPDAPDREARPKADVPVACGVNNWDMVLQKTLSLSERVHLQFRAESYNLFNRVQFGQPGNLTSNPGTFGQSTSEVKRPDLTTGARQIQFGMKLSF